MHKWTSVGLLIGGMATGAWMERESLLRLWRGYVQPPVATKTTVYSWQDKNGVWHYSSTKDDKHAQQVEVDTGKITRIKPPPPAPPKVKPTDIPNPLDIKAIRQDMIIKQRQMQEARERQVLDEG